MSPRPRLETLCVHGPRPRGAAREAAVPPIVQSSTFPLTAAALEAKTAGQARRSLIYTRYGNPTVWSLEAHLAALEGAESAVAFASGMAAITSTVLALTARGDHIVAPLGSYGTTVSFLKGLDETGERAFTAVADGEVASVRRALRPETRLILVESLSNPLNRVADLPALAELAHANGALLAVDATFASPVLQRPLELGADVVIHSASKYLNGHSDLIAGVAAGPLERIDRIWDRLRVQGCCLDPHAAFLLERGLRTLHLRMERICANAGEVAAFLEGHPAVETVHHPGLASHPHHERAARLLPRGCGGIVSFVIRGGDEAALRFCGGLELILEATSLGGVESLVSLPFNTSHAGMSAAERERAGIVPGTVRLAIGTEAAGDLIEDLEAALAAAVPASGLC